jgi:1,4-dihydroxy-2-naphthoyl-CoA synthase
MTILSFTSANGGVSHVVKATTAKAVNYTPEQTTKMVTEYQSGASVEEIAKMVGKSVRSVVAKLSREKVYVAKTYTTKSGEAVAKKDMVADAIGNILGLTEAETESLTKANKAALSKIFAALANSKPV